MQRAIHHHHFKQSRSQEFDRVERCERHVIDLLLETAVPDQARESSIAFELMHHHGTAQMARILGRKRQLSLDECVVGSLLHDIEVIVEGTYKDHAHRGAARAMAMLNDLGGFSAEELERIYNLIYYHSDKDTISGDPYIEFGKDADILDIFLLVRDPYAEYLLIKPLAVFKHYLRRAKLVWLEVGLPPEPRFKLLDTYQADWLGAHDLMPPMDFVALLERISGAEEDMPCAPPLLVYSSANGLVDVHFNANDWQEYGAALNSERSRLNGVMATPATIAHLQHASTFRSTEDAALGGPQAWIQEVESIIRAAHKCVAIWPLINVYEVVESEERLHEFGASGDDKLFARPQ